MQSFGFRLRQALFFATSCAGHIQSTCSDNMAGKQGSVKSDKSSKRGSSSMPPPAAPPVQKARKSQSPAVTAQHNMPKKCEVCDAKPIAPGRNVCESVPWFKRTKVGAFDLPTGPLCLCCGTIYIEQYQIIYPTEAEFITYSKHPKAKADIKEIKRIKAGGKKEIANEAVCVATQRGVRIPRPYVFSMPLSTNLSLSAQRRLANAGHR